MDRRELLRAEPVEFHTAYQSFPGSDNDFDLDQQIMYQDRQIEEQDEHLQAISRTAASLKQVGYRINDELSDQEEMLDDLHDGMSHTGMRLKRETQHVAYVSEKAKATGLCCTIFLLIVAIILVAALPF
eukprot:m.27198 g.27198  ORF g.27198 m.27198 type:complete len:129 (-) comp10187_c0_seq1:578-964(-)